MSAGDHVVIDGRTSSFLCTVCKTSEQFNLPIDVKALAHRADAFLDQHVTCATSQKWAEMQAAAHQARTELGADGDTIELLKRTMELLGHCPKCDATGFVDHHCGDSTCGKEKDPCSCRKAAAP